MLSPLDQIVERLKKALADRLVSVVLYGSAANGDLQAGYSDLNVLCVLSEITPRELAAVAPVFLWWRGLGNPAPLLLTRTEFATSTDCFAIEFHDIRDQHRILYGENVVEELQVDDSFYRAQVEHELRAKFLRLRHKAVGVLADRHLLSRLLADCLSTFCVLFRHALILHGIDAPRGKREALIKASEYFQFSAEPFERLFDLREGKAAARDLDFVKLLADYMLQISTVIEAVDRL
jgi:Nucleotidyltransferase domain